MSFPTKYIETLISSIWKYFKERSAHSKLAKYGLTVGAAILLGPLWQPVIIGYLSQTHNLNVDQTPTWYGLVLIVVSFIFFVLVERSKTSDHRKRNERKRLHDGEKLRELKDIVPNIWVEDFLSRLLSDHSYLAHDIRILRDLITYLGLTDNPFLIGPLVDAADEFVVKSAALERFMAYKFFPGRGNDRFVMFPQGNWDRGGPAPEQEAIYIELESELEDHVEMWNNARKVLLKMALEKTI